MAQTISRPELQAHETVTRADFPTVVEMLKGILGSRLVAYLGDVKETRAVHEWASARRAPSEGIQRRLRIALQVALMLSAEDGDKVAAVWFTGLNPQLNDQSPARTLREGEPEVAGSEVMSAARAFLVGG